MPKINQEEYEKIKLLPDYDWNWIAREKTGKILSFTNKPTKTDGVWKDKQTRLWFNYEDSQLFQFIQWEDEEPYEIAELIREYEIKELRLAPSGTVIVDSFDESEETEVKDIEELKSWFEDDKLYVGEYVKHKLNQLDEPEVLSQEWINEHAKAVTYDGIPDQTEIVYVDELENLIVPKQELPVIPKYVTEWITEHRDTFELYPALIRLEGNPFGWELVYKWYRMNTHKFVNAYLTGEYEVEEEPLYYALIKGHELVDIDVVYWVYDKLDESLFISDLPLPRDYILTEMSKAEWIKLGINDSNADFMGLDE